MTAAQLLLSFSIPAHRSPTGTISSVPGSSAETGLRLLGLRSHRNEQQINAALIKDDWKLLIGTWEGSPASRSQDEYGFSGARDCKHF